LLILPFSDTKIHLLDVSSLAELFVQLMKVENIHHRIFNVGDETAVSMRKLVDAIYYTFYKRKYPSFLRLPDWFFKLVIIFLHFIKEEKWLVRFLLLSKDWYYDISSATGDLGYKPTDTMSRLPFLVNESEKR
jgi:nucleoside-diphosphate-sugar epimerase